MRHSEIYQEYGNSVVPHGNVAWSKLELYILGTVVSDFSSPGEVLSGRKAWSCGVAYLYAARHFVWLDDIQV